PARPHPFETLLEAHPMSRILRSILLFFALGLGLAQPVLAQAQVAGKQQSPAVEPLRTAGDRPIDIQHIRLDLRVDLPGKAVDGVATLRVRSLRSIQHISLDAVGFEVKKVALTTPEREAVPAYFHHDGKKLVIDVEPAWPT